MTFLVELFTTDLNVPITYLLHLSHHIDLFVKITFVALVLWNIGKRLIYLEILPSYLLTVHNQTLFQLINSDFWRGKVSLFGRFRIKFNTSSHKFSPYLVAPTKHTAFMAWLLSSILCLLPKIIGFLGISHPLVSYLSLIFKRVVLG